MNLQDLYEKSNHAAFCFGRLNPPTLGHKQLLDTVAQAGQGSYYIFLSQSHKLPDNPLSYKEKVKFVKEMFPEHSAHVVTGPDLNTIMKVAGWVYNQGMRSVSFVAGSDRLEDFKALLDKYNGYGEPGQVGYYKFDTINYVSSGERDPDAEGVAGYSASKAREAASNNDFETFKEVTGAGKLAKSLYDAVKTAQAAAPVKKPAAKKTKEVAEDSETNKYQVVVKGDKRSYSVWVDAKNEEVAIIRAQQYVAREHNDTAKRAAVVDMKKGVAEGLNEFAPDGFNGGDDDEGFSPEIAKMAQEDGFTKGVSLADGATLERAMKINYWHTQHGGMYKQYFAKGFKAGRINKVNHDNKQYNLNLKLMKDGSIRHGEQGVAEGSLNEFDASGYKQRYTLYTGDAHNTYKVDTFSDLDAAIEEVDFLRDADPSTVTSYWQIKDINGEVVWNYDPGEAYDAMRSGKKIQYKKPGEDMAETIRKVKDGYRLVSHSGKNLGTYPSRAGAKNREHQVQYFKHVNENLDSQNNIKGLFGKFLPLAAEYLGLEKLPKINIELTLPDHNGQASFGGYNSNTKEINLAIANRHPVDIFRTLAHELVHYKQDQLGKIKDYSGETGSTEENQANSIAGIIMRLFNKEYPNAMNAEIISTVTKGIEEDVVDDTVQYHDELESTVWENGALKPEVRARLLTIAKEFIDSLNIDNFDALDIVLTGSMANYNYTKFSDFDLHVITDYDSIECAEIAEEFYQSKKRIWNSSYDIQIAGHDVELYVEDEDDPPVSGGVYSILDNKWIKEPSHQSPNVDIRAVRAKTREYVKKIKDALDGHLDAKKVQDLVKKLRDMRTAGLEKAGEFSVENLAYKTLRNAGVLDKLSDLRNHQITTDLSL
jgi:predicted nucleotidyltransferase